MNFTNQQRHCNQLNLVQLIQQRVPLDFYTVLNSSTEKALQECQNAGHQVLVGVLVVDFFRMRFEMFRITPWVDLIIREVFPRNTIRELRKPVHEGGRFEFEVRLLLRGM